MSEFWTWVGFGSGLVGLVLTVVGLGLTTKAMRPRKVSASYETTAISFPEDEDSFKVFWKGAELERPTITSVTFYAEGTKDISGEEATKIALTATADGFIGLVNARNKPLTMEEEDDGVGEGLVMDLFDNGIPFHLPPKALRRKEPYRVSFVSDGPLSLKLKDAEFSDITVVEELKPSSSTKLQTGAGNRSVAFAVLIGIVATECTAVAAALTYWFVNYLMR